MPTAVYLIFRQRCFFFTPLLSELWGVCEWERACAFFFFQMNLELTKIFKAKLLVCHCEIRFLTPLLMYAYFSPRIFFFNFMHRYSLLEPVTWLSQKGVSNTLIHLWNESGFFSWIFWKLAVTAVNWYSYASLQRRRNFLWQGIS